MKILVAILIVFVILMLIHWGIKLFEWLKETCWPLLFIVLAYWLSQLGCGLTGMLADPISFGGIWVIFCYYWIYICIRMQWKLWTQPEG